jgi:hypothetical protein
MHTLPSRQKLLRRFLPNFLCSRLFKHLRDRIVLDIFDW